MKITVYAAELRALRLLIETCGSQLAKAKDRTAIANLGRRLALGETADPSRTTTAE